ncbi:uncharacterized protein LOC128200765 [Galleria mellonella]|uniref:Uncharacterized protein LOC128200765 n=1 Tax=Galleria mellonella TaxID=7137 RepID=A0ABM3MIF0_GALME|nr:uncharacterized protein LOC128200765 [Galleria mellonella]
MRTATLCLLSFILFTLTSTCSGYHVSNSLTSSSNENSENLLVREKRQIENFDTDDLPTTPSDNVQDESSFWDRIVKVALRLFSKFVEWLNS